jgi:hypothetical protein
MPLPESPPRKNSKGTVQRDRILHILDPEGSEGHYARGGEVECDNEEEEEAERKKRKAGGVAPGLAAPPRGDKGQRGRKAGGRTANFNPGGHKGKLHRELGIPEGEKIGKTKLSKAAESSNPEIRRDAIRAQTMGKWHHK